MKKQDSKKVSQYFLTKTDPDTYSIQDFIKDQKTVWDGVHNFQAIKVIESWKVGDGVLIYHSLTDKKIVALAKVVSDPRQNMDDPRYSWVADLELVRVFPDVQQITLKSIKETGKFSDFGLIKQSRLSVMECPEEFILWLKEKGLDLSLNID